MNYIVIGTAGHVDHGKTSLIKALTSIDYLKGKCLKLDRLKEEREREMTIDLGFAHFYLPSGRCAEIIDVPGHEDLVRNMLAGISTIDLGLLVIAANEGVKPQTREHLDILKLLDIKKGIIVITKVDLIESEYLNLIIEDIRQTIKETFLETAPMVQTSLVNATGLNELVSTIDQIAEDITLKNITLPVRLPIDRVFTNQGFGTIVTGTLISGILKIGDTIQVMPQAISGRVRQIESHDQKVSEAKAGQRLGINIVGIKRVDLTRGNYLVSPGYLTSTTMFDANFTLLPTYSRPLKNNTRVRLYLGSGEYFGRFILLDKEVLKPGEKGFIQFRSESLLSVTKGDCFIVRLYAPMMTIGGGQVIDPLPIKHKRLEKEIVENLAQFEHANISETVEQVFLDISDGITEPEHLSKKLGLPKAMLESILNDLISKKIILHSTQSSAMMHQKKLEELKTKIIETLGDFHKHQPLRLGIPKQEMRLKVASNSQIEWFFNQALNELVHETKIQLDHNLFRLSHHTPRFTNEQMHLKEQIEQNYLSRRFNTPTLKEITQILNANPEEVKGVIQTLIEMGKLISLPNSIIIHQDSLAEASNILKDYLTKNKEIKVGEFTKLINTSRKYAVPMLEYFDQIKLTKRVDDFRILNI